MQIQAKLGLISRLSGDALYASPLQRAKESAAIVAPSLALQPTLSDELREIDFGGFEGLTFEAIEKQYPEEYRLWMERPTEIEFPHGESFARLKKRVLGFKAVLLRNHHGNTVHVVSHGSVNRILLAEALAMPDSMIFRLHQSYAALNIIDYLEQSPMVRLVNG
jgi:alpha-ribazole phosphatase/probable phosphoglycerate mutase